MIDFALPNSYFGPQGPGATVFVRLSQCFDSSIAGDNSSSCSVAEGLDRPGAGTGR